MTTTFIVTDPTLGLFPPEGQPIYVRRLGDSGVTESLTIDDDIDALAIARLLVERVQKRRNHRARMQALVEDLNRKGVERQRRQWAEQRRITLGEGA